VLIIVINKLYTPPKYLALTSKILMYFSLVFLFFWIALYFLVRI
jgi:hypothetical protein